MEHQFKRMLTLYSGFIPGIIFFGISILAIVFAIVPLALAIPKTYEDNQQLSQENGSLRAKLKILDSLETESIVQEVNDTTAALPGERHVPSLLATVDATAAKNSLTLVTMSLGATGQIATAGAAKANEDKKLGAAVMPYTVTLQGTVDQQRQFLADIVAVRRLMRVKSFSLTLNAQAAIETQYQLESFYAPFPKTAGNIKQKLVALSTEEQSVLDRVKELPIIAQTLGGTTELPAPNVGIDLRPDPFSP